MMDMRTPRAPKKLLFGVIVTVLALLGFLPHHHGGFYCNDPKLSFKFQGDTVSIIGYIVICTVFPGLLILVTEILVQTPEEISISNLKFRTLIDNIITWSLEYFQAFMFNLSLLEIAKYLIGEPRPHFFDTCRPDKLNSCITGEYVTNYTCTNNVVSKYLLDDSNKSFPSGHTSISLYMVIFLYWYLKQRSPHLKGKFPVAFLQISVIIFGLICSLTRITDHRHHWWDVLAGAILGTALSYFSIRNLTKEFSHPNELSSRSQYLNLLYYHHKRKNNENRTSLKNE